MLPASVISVPSGQCAAQARDVVDDSSDRRADDDQLGVGHALGQIDGGVGHGADAAGGAQTGLAAADADHRVGQSSLAQGQADRSADQSDADDGHRLEVFHARFRPGDPTE